MTDNNNAQVENVTKKKPWVTVVLLLASVYLVIEIAKSGYSFGQWLHRVFN
ncbi:MAG: hypothetical protein JNK00_10960 [Flavipsychrobacter sp.]|nr:hypothetical protein [Flavipsychrobacter sp.]